MQLTLGIAVQPVHMICAERTCIMKMIIVLAQHRDFICSAGCGGFESAARRGTSLVGQFMNKRRFVRSSSSILIR